MASEEIDLVAEIERVRGELILFRDTILPGLDLPLNVDPERADARGPHERASHSLKDWQRMVTRLVESLPSGTGAGKAPMPGRAAFEPFMFQEPTTRYDIQDGRIHWRIVLFAGTEADAALVFSWLGEEPDDPLGRIMADPHAFGERLLEIPVDNSALWNALCLTAPILADADPVVLRRLLDPETYHRRVQADRDVPPETRRERLRILGKWFGLVLNNALLHALAGLANNHFGVISGLLEHPSLMGRYTDLMAHYLFAVLFEKVSILHRLSRGDAAPERPRAGQEGDRS